MFREGEVWSPAESAEFIAQNANHVKIHEDGIERLSQEMLSSISDKLQIPDAGANINYPSKEDPRGTDWIFVADTLNFCFWSKAGADKWTVDGHSGYFALEAALARALKEGIDITNPAYYSKITDAQLRHVMRSDNSTTIPLFNERLSALHEVGAVLLEKYNSTFTNCLKEANKSAMKLLQIIIDNFPCFRDESVYRNQKVTLYKRAQILVADVWNFFNGNGLGEFNDIDKITMFADYRVPQVLVYFGVMSYSEELMKKLESDILLPSGSEEEVEIRGCSIHAVELLKKNIEKKLREEQKDVQVPNAALIDYYLWCYRRKYANELEKIPFHKTLGEIMFREGEVWSPAESAEFIAQNANHVKIHEDGIERLSQEMLSSISDKLQIPDAGANINYPSKEDPRGTDWIFVADTLNFCFWSKAGADKWTVDGHSGYFALEAALARALKEGIDITNPAYYSKITDAQLRHVMRSDNSTTIPLFNERLSALHEVGAVLLEKYNSTFTNCLKEANKSAMKLLQIIIDNFPCFRDESVYRNQKVTLYKRAQILVADVWNFFNGNGLGEFNDIDKITMFADYRVPQVLVYFGVMSYSEELMKKLESDILLPSGSEEEVEIRGCSIHAVELLKKNIEKKLREEQKDVQVPNAALIDYYLWCYRRKYANELEKIPFHKTLGIFY